MHGRTGLFNMPRWLPNTWNETCCPTQVVCDDSTSGTPISGAGFAEFATTEAMLSSDTSLWISAATWNDAAGDGMKARWFRTGDALVDNGDDIRVSYDGSVLRREWVR